MADSIYFNIGQYIEASSGFRYRNLQTLGVGGNAVTFLVVATSGPFEGVNFAMKVFRKLTKPERKISFFQEIDFLKKCDHPAIMRLFDQGEYQERNPFFIAEYLPLTLRQIIQAKSATMVAKISYTLQLLSALTFLGGLSEPVIHRDIKPENVFIKGHSCVLGDFGLMKMEKEINAEDQAIFKESVGVGMPFRYRTPDLVAYLNEGSQPTTKSDVFQLGVVLAELFTSKNPQKRAEAFTDPVVIDPIGPIPGTMADTIANLINQMLELSPRNRQPASKFLAFFQGVFFDAIKLAHNLEGKVF